MRVAELLLIVVTGSVVFVNGWTDAPNAIANAVAAKAISYRKAVSLAALCNLLGLVVMSLVNASVADTVMSLADFGAVAPGAAVAALLAAMASVVIFAVFAWAFGIPTSESHALIASLSGAALALGGRVNAGAWAKTLVGLVISLVCGFFLARLFAAALKAPLGRLTERLLDRLQIFAAAAMAFLHGAQDGQKFAAVFVAAELAVRGTPHSGAIDLKQHLLVLSLCAVAMAAGTGVGGRRIVETVGEKMVRLSKPESVCADLASGLCLLGASLCGVPVSTTHTKTTAIMGAADKKTADLSVIGGMFLAWGVTFPVCGALGYALARLVLGAI